MNKSRVRLSSFLLLSMSFISPMEAMKKNPFSNVKKGSISVGGSSKKDLNNGSRFNGLAIHSERDMAFSFAPSYSSYEIIYDRNRSNLNNNSINLNDETENINTRNLPDYQQNRVKYLTSMLTSAFSGRDVNFLSNALRNNPSLSVKTFLGDNTKPRTSWTNDFRVELNNQGFPVSISDDSRGINYNLSVNGNNEIANPGTIVTFTLRNQPTSRVDSNILEYIRRNLGYNNRLSKLQDVQLLLAFMQFLCTNHDISWIKSALKQSNGFLALSLTNDVTWRVNYDKILINSKNSNDFDIVFTENANNGVTIHAYRPNATSCWNFELVSFS